MEAATLPEQDQDQEREAEEGAPVEHAEATRTAHHLFQFSAYVHAGAGARECEHAQDGKCQEEDHFHAWLCLPNTLQHRDIQEKAKAAKARRKRALRDAGGEGRPASDAYITLESELDDLMRGDRTPILEQLAEREVREHFGDYVVSITEQEQFENYDQDKEEYLRLVNTPEDERDEEEFKALDQRMSDFADAIDKRVQGEREREVSALRAMTEEQVRERLRDMRIMGEANEASTNAYYIWLAFVGTRKCGNRTKRYFATLEDFRAAPPEAVQEIDTALHDLEGRMIRGDAAGN